MPNVFRRYFFRLRLTKIYFGASRDDAATAGFDDKFIYDELNKSTHTRKIPMHECERVASRII